MNDIAKKLAIVVDANYVRGTEIGQICIDFDKDTDEMIVSSRPNA